MAGFLSAQWRHLAMVSWPVDRTLLEPLVPAGTELAYWGSASRGIGISMR